MEQNNREAARSVYIPGVVSPCRRLRTLARRLMEVEDTEL